MSAQRRRTSEKNETAVWSLINEAVDCVEPDEEIREKIRSKCLGQRSKELKKISLESLMKDSPTSLSLFQVKSSRDTNVSFCISRSDLDHNNSLDLQPNGVPQLLLVVGDCDSSISRGDKRSLSTFPVDIKIRQTKLLFRIYRILIRGRYQGSEAQSYKVINPGTGQLSDILSMDDHKTTISLKRSHSSEYYIDGALYVPMAIEDHDHDQGYVTGQINHHHHDINGNGQDLTSSVKMDIGTDDGDVTLHKGFYPGFEIPADPKYPNPNGKLCHLNSLILGLCYVCHQNGHVHQEFLEVQHESALVKLILEMIHCCGQIDAHNWFQKCQQLQHLLHHSSLLETNDVLRDWMILNEALGPECNRLKKLFCIQNYEGRYLPALPFHDRDQNLETKINSDPLLTSMPEVFAVAWNSRQNCDFPQFFDHAKSGKRYFAIAVSRYLSSQGHYDFYGMKNVSDLDYCWVYSDSQTYEYDINDYPWRDIKLGETPLIWYSTLTF